MIENALFGNYASKKSAEAAKSGARESTAIQREMFNRGIEITDPFRQFGAAALPVLAAEMSAPAEKFSFREPGQFLNEYFQSPEFQALNKQATDQILRNRSATGGLRSGGTNVDLATITPTFGINALNRANSNDLTVFGVNQSANQDRFNRLFGAASLGANVATGNQTAGMNFGANAGANAIFAGKANANKYNQYAENARGFTTDLATLALRGGI